MMFQCHISHPIMLLPWIPQEPEVGHRLALVVQHQVLVVYIDTRGMGPLVDVVLETWDISGSNVLLCSFDKHTSSNNKNPVLPLVVGYFHLPG